MKFNLALAGMILAFLMTGSVSACCCDFPPMPGQDCDCDCSSGCIEISDYDFFPSHKIGEDVVVSLGLSSLCDDEDEIFDVSVMLEGKTESLMGLKFNFSCGCDYLERDFVFGTDRLPQGVYDIRAEIRKCGCDEVIEEKYLGEILLFGDYNNCVMAVGSVSAVPEDSELGDMIDFSADIEIEDDSILRLYIDGKLYKERAVCKSGTYSFSADSCDLGQGEHCAYFVLSGCSESRSDDIIFGISCRENHGIWVESIDFSSRFPDREDTIEVESEIIVTDGQFPADIFIEAFVDNIRVYTAEAVAGVEGYPEKVRFNIDASDFALGEHKLTVKASAGDSCSELASMFTIKGECEESEHCISIEELEFTGDVIAGSLAPLRMKVGNCGDFPEEDIQAELKLSGESYLSGEFDLEPGKSIILSFNIPIPDDYDGEALTAEAGNGYASDFATTEYDVKKEELFSLRSKYCVTPGQETDFSFIISNPSSEEVEYQIRAKGLGADFIDLPESATALPGEDRKVRGTITLPSGHVLDEYSFEIEVNGVSEKSKITSCGTTSWFGWLFAGFEGLFLIAAALIALVVISIFGMSVFRTQGVFVERV